MEVIKLTKDKYKDWDNFCFKSDDAWFWHTTNWLEYNLNYKPKLNPENKSFLVVNNKQILAICPLILETNSSVKEFSFGGIYGPIPAFLNEMSEKMKNKVMKMVFAEIDNLALENSVKRVLFRFSVLNKRFIENNQQRYNYLMKFGYLDNSLNTRIIGLSKNISDLRKDIRHGHDYDIDKASKILKAEIFFKDNINKEIFHQYENLHYKASGRKTRPKITFDLMYQCIEKDNAFLIGAKREDVFVGFSYFYLFKNNVYYGSSCNNPDFLDIPISHFIQWVGIKEMRKRNCEFYEIGRQYYSYTLSDFPEPKEVNISRFKRGFGGFTMPLFRGEKYYDKDYFIKVQNERINKFKDNIK